ncbi:MAG: outer membrane beta-barrel protein [Anaeromyxobacteraceae bacterium]
MSVVRLAALALLAAPFASFAQPAPGALPAAAPAAAAPVDGFTQRGRILADTVLRGGPDGLAQARATVPAGMEVALVPGLVRGFVRVKVPTGESGYVRASDVGLEEGAPRPPSVSAVPAAASGAPTAPPAAPRALAPPPPPASADRTRFIARGGFALPADDDLEGFDAGFALEVGIVTPLAPNLALELTAGWSRLSADEHGVEIRFNSVPLLAGLRLVAPSPKLEAYVVVGGGVSLVGLSGQYLGTGASDSGKAAVLQLGAGVGVPLAGGSRFELGVRYYAGKAELFDVKGGIDTTTVFMGWAL